MASSSNFDSSNNDSNAISDSPKSDGSDDMTEEELQQYYKAVSESGGFDVPYFPNSEVYGRIEPMLNFKPWQKELDRVGDVVIRQYNEQNETNLEIVEFVKVNYGIAAGMNYFMTFKAKPSGTPADHPTTTFQAQVLDGIQAVEVDFCRPLPLPLPLPST